MYRESAFRSEKTGFDPFAPEPLPHGAHLRLGPRHMVLPDKQLRKAAFWGNDFVVSLAMDGTLALFSAHTGALLKQLVVEAPREEDDSPVLCFAFVGNEPLMLAGGSSLSLIDLQTFSVVKRHPVRRLLRVSALSAAPTAPWFLAQFDKTLYDEIHRDYTGKFHPQWRYGCTSVMDLRTLKPVGGGVLEDFAARENFWYRNCPLASEFSADGESFWIGSHQTIARFALDSFECEEKIRLSLWQHSVDEHVLQMLPLSEDRMLLLLGWNGWQHRASRNDVYRIERLSQTKRWLLGKSTRSEILLEFAGSETVSGSTDNYYSRELPPPRWSTTANRQSVLIEHKKQIVELTGQENLRVLRKSVRPLEAAADNGALLFRDGSGLIAQKPNAPEAPNFPAAPVAAACFSRDDNEVWALLADCTVHGWNSVDGSYLGARSVGINLRIKEASLGRIYKCFLGSRASKGLWVFVEGHLRTCSDGDFDKEILDAGVSETTNIAMSPDGDTLAVVKFGSKGWLFHREKLAMEFAARVGGKRGIVALNPNTDEFFLWQSRLMRFSHREKKLLEERDISAFHTRGAVFDTTRGWLWRLSTHSRDESILEAFLPDTMQVQQSMMYAIPPWTEAHTGELLVMSPDGRFLAWPEIDGTLRVYQPSTNNMKTYETRWRGISAIAFAHNTSTLVAGGDDGTLVLWNLS